MSRSRIMACSILLLAALGACGGSGEAAGLKHRVSDKELRGLTGDGVMRIDAQKSEVAKLRDALASGDLGLQQKKKEIVTTSAEKDKAGDAIEVAADKIEIAESAQEKELAAARERRDQKIAEAKQRFDAENEQIREKYKVQQAQHRKTIADAKTSQALAALEESVLKAELAETKARQDLRKQEIRVEEAELEQVKFEELLKMTGVQGAKETQRKVNLDQQMVNEQKKLIALQTVVAKREAETQAARAKLEAEERKLQPPPQ